ncbi:MAG TPA: cobyric acid synthase, partial [Pyrinomonadaceae bacterium]|nr:cobyric acid synthase [Pyrinomonadaceae bacterium]
MSARALMVLGTGSDAGKSLTVAALCRILRQDGFNVAPFKAQNMALNSFATIDGHEIGRAQAMQAQAAGVEPHVDMNPILLKPTSDVGSQVILNGKVAGNYRGVDYYELKDGLLEVVSTAYERLASRRQIVVLEGAGSPVEMNLKDRDVVNLKMAEIANAACMLVADIDRGGVFGSLIGTYSLLEPSERARFCGFLINKFRGDLGLFTDGVEYLEQKLDQPCLGVIPYLHNHGIDDEDSVSLERRAVKVPSANGEKLTVCVVGFPYLANFTDFTALEQQPDVVVYYTRRPDEARLADVLILPGSKNTISDLLWLKQNGWTTAIEEHVAAGKPLLGVCGGFQMLGTEISDPYHTEGEVTVAQGVGTLDIKTVLAREKVTRQASASFYNGSFLNESPDNPVFKGYEIHLGETSLGEGVKPLFSLQRAGDDEIICDGAVTCDGKILGTYLHGLFDSVDGLRWILNHWRRLRGKHVTSSNVIDPKVERERRYDALADHFRQHLN